jgi:hypothetical protein
MSIKPEGKTLRAISCGALAAAALLLSACAAATLPAGAGAPRGKEAPKFATFAESDEQRKAALASWKEIVGQQAAATAPTPELQPLTATIKSLPANLQTPPRLPLVTLNDRNAKPVEAVREALRRFLKSASPLVGVELSELSLEEIAGAQGSTRTARYVQTSFPYPLRNGYGSVEVTFTPDLRITGLTSTAIPDPEPLRRALAAVTASVTADKAAASLANRTVTFNDSGGNKQTRTITQADATTARSLVIFPVRSATDPQTLELHIAWEVAVAGPTAPLLVYVDAVTGEQLGASQGTATGDKPAEKTKA